MRRSLQHCKALFQVVPRILDLHVAGEQTACVQDSFGTERTWHSSNIMRYTSDQPRKVEANVYALCVIVLQVSELAAALY